MFSSVYGLRMSRYSRCYIEAIRFDLSMKFTQTEKIDKIIDDETDLDEFNEDENCCLNYAVCKCYKSIFSNCKKYLKDYIDSMEVDRYCDCDNIGVTNYTCGSYINCDGLTMLDLEERMNFVSYFMSIFVIISLNLVLFMAVCCKSDSKLDTQTNQYLMEKYFKMSMPSSPKSKMTTPSSPTSIMSKSFSIRATSKDSVHKTKRKRRINRFTKYWRQRAKIKSKKKRILSNKSFKASLFKRDSKSRKNLKSLKAAKAFSYPYWQVKATNVFKMSKNLSKKRLIEKSQQKSTKGSWKRNFSKRSTSR